MTRLDFYALCEKYTVDPLFAFENESLRKAVYDSNDEEIERILREEF